LVDASLIKIYLKYGMLEVDMISVIIIILIIEEIQIIPRENNKIIRPRFERITALHEVAFFLGEFHQNFFVLLQKLLDFRDVVFSVE